MNKATYIIEKNGVNIQNSKFELNELDEVKSGKINYEIIDNDSKEFRDSVTINAFSKFKYIAREKVINIKKSRVIMNRQM